MLIGWNWIKGSDSICSIWLKSYVINKAVLTIEKNYVSKKIMPMHNLNLNIPIVKQDYRCNWRKKKKVCGPIRASTALCTNSILKEKRLNKPTDPYYSIEPFCWPRTMSLYPNAKGYWMYRFVPRFFAH